MILDRFKVADSYRELHIRLANELWRLSDAESIVMHDLSVLCGVLALTGDNEEERNQNSIIAIGTFGQYMFECGKK